MLFHLIACTSNSPSRPLPELSEESSPPADSRPEEPLDTARPEVEDPGHPELGESVETLSVSLFTHDEAYAGTDDALKLCVEEQCWGLYRDDWDDNERGAREVFHLEAALPVEGLEGVRLEIDDGGNQYRPECLTVSLDGHPWLCQDGLELKMGSEGEELPEVAFEAELACLGCWDSVLTHGPLWGPPEPSAISLSYRLDATRRVELFAQREGGPEWLVHIGYPLAERDFTEQVRVEDLAGGTWTIRMVVEGEEVGRWSHSLPTGQEQSLRFAYGSCSKDSDTQPIFETLAAWDPELFLFVGDNHYGNTADLGAQRQNYRLMRDVPERAAFLVERPVLATWDDHDFVGNNTDASDPGGEIALQAFAEYWTNPSYGTSELPGAFTRQVVGPAEFFLLDDRSFRGTDDSLLGAEQTAWLLEGLASSQADFKFVVCGSQFTAEGSSDSWAAFDSAREALHQQLDEGGITGVIFLSGDIHRSELRLDPGTRVPEWSSSHLAYPTNSSCQDESWLACFDEGPSFIGVEVDASLEDPTATASIVALDGSIQATHTVRLSELGPAR